MSPTLVLAISCVLVGILLLAAVELLAYNLRNFSQKRLESIFAGGCLLVVVDFLSLLSGFVLSQINKTNWSVQHYSAETAVIWLVVMAIGCFLIYASVAKAFSASRP